jgi:hypothetical protein
MPVASGQNHEKQDYPEVVSIHALARSDDLIFIKKTLPPPGLSSTHIEPPCASTIVRQMANPNPTL